MTRNEHGWHNGPHVADWPGGSGRCFCTRPCCWFRARPGPNGEDLSGVCICRDCPCGGHERLSSMGVVPV